MDGMGPLQPLSLTRFRRNQYLPRVRGPVIESLAFFRLSGEFGVSESLNHQIAQLEKLYKSDLDPKGRAFVPLADAHRRLGDLDKALEVIQEGLGEHPDFASAHIVAGWVHRSREEPDNAMRSFQRVLTLDVENTLARAAIAELIDDQRAQTYREKLAARGSTEPMAGVTAKAEVPVVGIATLAPGAPDEDAGAVVSIDWLAPGAPAETTEAPDTAPEAVPSVAGRPVVRIASLAPGAEDETSASTDPVPMGDAPPAVPIASLAPMGGDIYTQTLAELYAGQGAIDEAIEVYQKLITHDPENETLTKRLTELEALLLGSERQTVPIESLAPEGAAG